MDDPHKRLASLQKTLDSFKDKVTAKFEGYINGIALLPQPKEQPPTMGQPLMQEKPDPKDIHVLVLVDDTDSKKMSKLELKEKLSASIESIAKDVDKHIKPQTVIYSELWQQCFDAKYDLLQLIAQSATVYDLGMLAAIKISEVHKTMVLKKFEKYIVSYVLAGSLVQGKATSASDIDVFIVIDDTDVKKMTRVELRDKLRAIIYGMGQEAGQITGVQNKINIQVYILTDFWDSIKEANPVIFTFLRDGVPFYDRGIFMPWKQLLKMGKIRPSMEAIDIYMNSGSQVLDRVKLKMKEMGMEDFFYSILTPSQAVLMLYGIPPPTPKETPKVMRDIFVKKEKMLEDSYVKTLEKVIKLRKDLEHGSVQTVSGKQLDELLESCTAYMKRIDELSVEIEQRRADEDLLHIEDTIGNMLGDILRIHKKEFSAKNKVAKFKGLVDEDIIPKKYVKTLDAVLNAQKGKKKLSKPEVEKVRISSQELIRFLVEHIQRARGREIERTKIRVKHGDKFGEVLLLDKTAYIIYDIDAEQREIQKAEVLKSGALGKLTKSSMEELEEALAKLEIPTKSFIHHNIFSQLPTIFSNDVEILMNY